MSADLTRRRMLAIAGGAIATELASGMPGAVAAGSSRGLGELGRRAGVLFGAAISTASVDSGAETELYERETRIVTVDPDLLLPFLRPAEDRFVPEPAERIVAFGAARGIAVRGHALIWNDNVPDWVRRLPARAIAGWLDRHVEETVSRFRGRLHSWDVVNEPVFPGHRRPGGLRAGPWLDAIGPGYVARAFRRAAAVADPHCRLVLNEAFTERADEMGRATRRHLLALLDRLKDEGARVDAVGLQGHLDPRVAFDAGAWRAFLGEIAARGHDIYITELDVVDLELDGSAPERDRIVAARYRALLDAALSEPAVKVVVTWELADHRSWLRNPWFVDRFPARRRRFPARPLPFDDRLRPKLARDAIAAAFRARRL